MYELSRSYWLRTQPEGMSNEWLLARLLVEDQLGTAPAAAGLRARLLDRQQADGGWPWLAGPARQASDALTTGQALYALRLAGLDGDHAAIRRGAAYLMRTQRPDGAWIVPAKLVSTRDEPGGKIEYIYKFWGTAWATIGLARSARDVTAVAGPVDSVSTARATAPLPR